MPKGKKKQKQKQQKFTKLDDNFLPNCLNDRKTIIRA